MQRHLRTKQCAIWPPSGGLFAGARGPKSPAATKRGFALVQSQRRNWASGPTANLDFDFRHRVLVKVFNNSKIVWLFRVARCRTGMVRRLFNCGSCPCDISQTSRVNKTMASLFSATGLKSLYSAYMSERKVMVPAIIAGTVVLLQVGHSWQ